MKSVNTNTNVIAGAGDVSHGIGEGMKIFSELIKFRITAMVSFTTGLGYILAADEITFAPFYVIAGIFLLACASSALNHWQERDTDALMDRTKYRPIPSGRIEAGSALYAAFGLLLSGSALLLLTTNFMAFAIGIFTFFWYNGVYTPLKRKTAFAIIPGALVGSLPPLAGWASAGGNISDIRIIIIAFYFFIWQIPHFWLLLMLYGSDYEKGGFPTLNDVFEKQQLKRITFMWLIGNVLAAMMIPLFLNINYTLSLYLLILISVWMAFVSLKFFRSDDERNKIRNTFVAINFYTLLLITLLSFDKLIKVF
ncbi:MAG: heme o synthase [Chlorobi bacterium]|nr:heme o synthase [Chlorobiota bacterium]MCI0716443.1 heme o synthase [Chlorobiota bacterium]